MYFCYRRFFTLLLVICVYSLRRPHVRAASINVTDGVEETGTFENNSSNSHGQETVHLSSSSSDDANQSSSHGNNSTSSHGDKDSSSHGDSHSSSHDDSHSSSHGDSHSSSHDGSHSDSHGDSHSGSHGDSHSGSHGDSHSGSHGDSHSGSHGGHHSGVSVVGLHFEEVKMPVIICGVIILAAITKLGFHHMEWLSQKLPESCLLIVIGVIIGAILHFSGGSEALPHFFESHEFFLYLLPPIILEASFSLHDSDFFDNIKAILVFSVIGTTLACFLLGGALYGLAIVGAMGPIDIAVIDLLIFSALICAVDPVAVLAVFEEIGVNKSLYFLVFGESLLNDGVTVVIYKVMQQLNGMAVITAGEVFTGVAAFFVVAGLGLVIGVVGGLITAFITKYTTSVRIVEPISVFCFAYMSFLAAEIFEVSGIISIIGFGLVQRQYTFGNITEESRTTIEYFAKVIATTNEVIIFLFLGLALVRPDHVFHVGFCLWTLLLILVFRFLITFGLTWLLNRYDFDRAYPISYEEQFIISYGGLRGAVAFSLVALLDPSAGPNTRMFVTTTLAVVIFTVFIQGITIKPFVYLLEIGMAKDEDQSFYQEMSVQVIGDLMVGVEAVIGFKGQNRFRKFIRRINDTYIKKHLQKYPTTSQDEILDTYSKLALKEHLETLRASGVKNIPVSSSTTRALGGKDPETYFANKEKRGSMGAVLQLSVKRPAESQEGKPEVIQSAFELRRYLAKSHNQGVGHDRDLSKEKSGSHGFLAQLEEKRQRFKRLKENPVRMKSAVRMALGSAAAKSRRQSVTDVLNVAQFRRASSASVVSNVLSEEEEDAARPSTPPLPAVTLPGVTPAVLTNGVPAIHVNPAAESDKHDSDVEESTKL